MNSTQRPAIFLDRDGTIIHDAEYISKPRDVQLLPGACEGLLKLQKAGFLLIIISNQSGVGREIFSEEEMQQVHERMVELLSDENITIDGAYYCLHHPDEECGCRKPQPGLLKLATEELDVAISQSYMIGDKVSDVEAGLNAGCQPLLIRTKQFISPLSRMMQKPLEIPPAGVPITADLRSASKWILADQAKKNENRRKGREKTTHQ